MTVSMRVMSAGEGYRYLLKGVATGDRDRKDPNSLVGYYAEDGNPPGRWLGSGLHALGGGEIKRWDAVTPQQLALLLGIGRDPVSGDRLGRAFPEYCKVSARIASWVADLSPEMTGEQRAAAVTQIKAEEVAAGQQRAVAGFDFTFSVPKSVSALWGVAGVGTQALIVEAHHQALAEALAFLEREVATTRRGVDAGDGAVAQADSVGIAATAYNHWDSRLGDPQLHTHVVISNKVKTVQDGRWRSLDGRPMHAAVVAISEHYNAGLAYRITRTFGIEWEQRDRGKHRNPAWELAPVNEAVIQEFSRRSRAIDKEKDRLIEENVAQHGRSRSSGRAQRGTNENTDRLLRQYFPKGTDISRWSAEAIEAVAAPSTPGRARPSTGGHPPRHSMNISCCSNSQVLVLHPPVEPGQFRSKKVIRLLKNNGLRGSMGRVASAGDNAAMESSLAAAEERPGHQALRDPGGTPSRDRHLDETKYNRRRPQRALGKLTRVEFEVIYSAAAAA